VDPFLIIDLVYFQSKTIIFFQTVKVLFNFHSIITLMTETGSEYYLKIGGLAVARR